MSLMGHFPDISIHALREESDYIGARYVPVFAISIHALREESDWVKTLTCDNGAISIHALREESDRADC